MEQKLSFKEIATTIVAGVVIGFGFSLFILFTLAE